MNHMIDPLLRAHILPRMMCTLVEPWMWCMWALESADRGQQRSLYVHSFCVYLSVGNNVPRLWFDEAQCVVIIHVCCHIFITHWGWNSGVIYLWVARFADEYSAPPTHLPEATMYRSKAIIAYNPLIRITSVKSSLQVCDSHKRVISPDQFTL